MTCLVALPLREESGVIGTVQPKAGHVMTRRGEIDLVFFLLYNKRRRIYDAKIPRHY